MDDPIETIEYKDFSINVYYDNDPISPREWDNLGIMVCWHTRYILGDMQPNISPIDYMDDIQADEYIILPLFLYDHGGICMNCRGFYDIWDSSQVGYIYVSKADIRKEYNWKYLTKKRLDRIQSYLETEVQIYSYYLTGLVYWYEIVNPEGESLESCGGFYGNDHEWSGLLNDAKMVIDYTYCKEKSA